MSSNLTPSATRLIFQWARHRAVPFFEQPTRFRSSKKFMRTSLAAPRDALIARGRWVWYWLRRGLWSDHILTVGPCRSAPVGAFAFQGVWPACATRWRSLVIAGEQRRRHSAKERPPRGGFSEIGSGVLIRRWRVQRRSSASYAGARERAEHDARPLHRYPRSCLVGAVGGPAVRDKLKPGPIK